MKDYAQHHGLSVSAFYAWKKTLRRRVTSVQDAEALLPFNIDADALK